MKSNRKHYHLSLYSLHKFPLSTEKWGQIATMVSDPLWKEYIKYIIKSKPSKAKTNCTVALSTTAISHLDRSCWHNTRTHWLSHLRERIEHTPVSPHMLRKREKRPQNIAELHWLGWAHVKGKSSSLAPLCGLLMYQKQHGHSLMFKLVKLGNTCFLSCK